MADTVRLIDVAERAGVSIATASRSLNGATGVSQAVAERVRAVAELMGYVANPHARSLAGLQQPSVGLVVGDIADPYFTEIAAGVIQAAAPSETLVQISHAADPAELVAQVRHLRAARIGAIIVAGSGRAESQEDDALRRELDGFREAGGRVAVIGRHALDADAVLPDNVGGGRLAARHVLQLGHRRVAVIAGPPGLTAVADRLTGVAAELGDHMLWLGHHPFDRDGGSAGTRELLSVAPDATAIIALSDVMALGVMAELRHRAVAVPGDMSVVGFDDIAAAAELSPALTTVRLDMRDLGVVAFQLTRDARDADAAGTSRRVPTAAELVVRGTTAEPSRR